MSITYLKQAVPTAQVAKNLADVKETVTGVIADIRERGDEAVRAYSAKFDNWSPESFLLSAGQSRTSWRPCHRRSSTTSSSSRRRCGGSRGRSSSPCGRSRSRRCRASSSATGTCRSPRRRLHPRRPLPAHRLRPHDRADRQGWPASAGWWPARRRSAARYPPPPSPPPTWPGRTRSTCSAASRRSPRWPSVPEHRPGRPAGGPGQRLRGRGQAAAVRRGRHRPVRRADRDPGDRRR